MLVSWNMKDMSLTWHRIDWQCWWVGTWKTWALPDTALIGNVGELEHERHEPYLTQNWLAMLVSWNMKDMSLTWHRIDWQCWWVGTWKTWALPDTALIGNVGELEHERHEPYLTQHWLAMLVSWNMKDMSLTWHRIDWQCWWVGTWKTWALPDTALIGNVGELEHERQEPYLTQHWLAMLVSWNMKDMSLTWHSIDWQCWWVGTWKTWALPDTALIGNVGELEHERHEPYLTQHWLAMLVSWNMKDMSLTWHSIDWQCWWVGTWKTWALPDTELIGNVGELEHERHEPYLTQHWLAMLVSWNMKDMSLTWHSIDWQCWWVEHRPGINSHTWHRFDWQCWRDGAWINGHRHGYGINSHTWRRLESWSMNQWT